MNNAFLIFFSGFLISEVIKVTLFQVIEANSAPTMLVEIIFKVSKFQLIWLCSKLKLEITVSILKPKKIPANIIAIIEIIFVKVKMF